MSPQNSRFRYRSLRLALLPLCALLFLALLAIWIFSYARSANYLTMRSQVIYGFDLNRGHLALYRQPYRYKFGGNKSIAITAPRDTPPAPLFPGFERLKGSRIGGWRLRLCWPTLTFGLLAAALSIQTLRRRPSTTAHCPTCGYDCRATPDRCPECGTARVANHASITDHQTFAK